MKRGKPKRPKNPMQEEVDRQRNIQIDNAFICDIPRAYALVPAPTKGGIPAWFLLKIEVRNGIVISVDKSVENLRGVHLQEIEDDILRDA